jgi:hypothetical protein
MLFGRNALHFGRKSSKRTLRQRVAERAGIAGVFSLIAVPIALVIACIAAWFTHVIVCLTAGKWGFLIAGALAFPIAIIHGVMIWFGYGR